jgi:hypothetical protein
MSWRPAGCGGSDAAGAGEEMIAIITGRAASRRCQEFVTTTTRFHDKLLSAILGIASHTCLYQGLGERQGCLLADILKAGRQPRKRFFVKSRDVEPSESRGTRGNTAHESRRPAEKDRGHAPNCGIISRWRLVSIPNSRRTASMPLRQKNLRGDQPQGAVSKALGKPG